MSLRQSPGLTPELLAAVRRNAQHSTGPRTPAAKENTRMNALRHGQCAAPENHPEVMLALGEDPEEFEFRLLDEEIAGVREEFEYAEQANQQKAAIERDACLAPVGETWRMLLRQENALDRAIDRKVRILLSLRKEYSDDKMAAGIPPPEDDDPELKEVEQVLGIDIPSKIPADGQGIGTSKMHERTGNVTENKDPLWKTPPSCGVVKEEQRGGAATQPVA